MARTSLRSLAALLSRCAGALTLWAAVWLAVAPSAAVGARVKDLARIQGVRTNPLIGYGIVVGLSGTGDSSSSLFANRSLAGLLAKLGVVVRPDDLKVTNVAAVMVTADLPPFARVGETLDITISSIGDSQSLQGATLLATPLLAVDGEVYALAQGPVTIGGFALGGGAGGDSVQQNHPTVGRVPRGAIVEREIVISIQERKQVRLVLHDKDFTTAARMADALNRKLERPLAKAQDAGTVEVQIPLEARLDPVPFLSQVQETELVPARAARVVLNERTGTVVMGSEVEISPVAIAHGNLSITVAKRTQVSQPEAFAEGATVVFQNDEIVVQEEGSKLIVVQGVTIGELVSSLNAIGVTPRDLIAILQSVKAAGALQGELRVI